MVGFKRLLAGQHAVSALAPSDPVEPQPSPGCPRRSARRSLAAPCSASPVMPTAARRGRAHSHCARAFALPSCFALRYSPSGRPFGLMPRAPTDRTPRALRSRPSGSRGFRGTLASENIWASSDRSCRCFSVACAGTRSTNTCATGLPSGESNGIGDFRRTNAPLASASPRMRPCGIAMPCPSPVEPSFSRACRLSTTTFLDSP